MLKDQKGNWERDFERGKDREEENRNGLGEDNWESLIYGENTEKPRKRKVREQWKIKKVEGGPTISNPQPLNGEEAKKRL